MPTDPTDPMSSVGEVALAPMHAVVGIVQHPVTELWQLWIWVEGPEDAQLASPAACRDRVQIQLVASMCLVGWQSGKPFDLHAQVAGSAEILLSDALSINHEHT
jgi:hypothetical protein